ncbi:MAG: molybdopterin-dependent oxidoreductase [bacterium]|nr:molybdopterin-dependent oxidoreductase [bacterium]MDE0667804.1 molybdopterin-dependent oxidoreductase [bacterium]
MRSDPSDYHDAADGGRGRRAGLSRLRPRPGSPLPWAALAGLLSAGAAISVGELISGISERTPSLILAVADAIVDSRYVPGGVIRWSIDTFGSAQKPLLFYGVLGATLALGALTGIVARRRRWAILVVFAAFGTLGGLAANVHPTAATSIAVVTATLATLVGAGAMWGMLRLIPRAEPGMAAAGRAMADTAGAGRVTAAPAPTGAGPATAAGTKARQPHPYLNETGRRWFLTAAGATAVGALAASGVGRYLLDRRGNVEEGRASVADLLSTAEVRTDTGTGTATPLPPTTITGSATPTDPSGGSETVTTPGDTGTTKATSGPGGQTIEDPAAPAAATGETGGETGSETTPTSVAADEAAPATAAGGGSDVADGAAPGTTQPTGGDAAGAAASPDPAAGADQPAPGATPAAPPAGGEAPPVGSPGERTTTTQAPPTTTQAPPPTTQAPPPPPATQAPAPQRNRAGYYDNTVAGISPIVTPNSDFYRIDTAIVVPSVDVNSWELSISGMVDRPYKMNFAQLIEMGLVETPVTLSCVSNEVGGHLVDNAVWRGVPLSDVLNRAGVQRGATQIVGRSVDNWNSGFPTEYAFDGRTALVAVAMNGEPLPREHGFPARLVIAGLYGYVSATKWLEEIRLTTWEGFDSYWVPRGWAKRGPIKTQSRIDVPRGGSRVRAGRVAIAGIAWAPTKSIASVEVQVGDGPWAAAEVSNNMSVNSWRQWVYAWDARPGSYRIRCRATDGTGYTQTSDIRPPAPDGATGWHTIDVRVV